MIFPEPRGDKLHQKGKAFFSTLLLAGGAYGAMLLGSYSLHEPDRKLYREVDLTHFAPTNLELDFLEGSTPVADLFPAAPQTIALLDVPQLSNESLSLPVDAPEGDSSSAEEEPASSGEINIDASTSDEGSEAGAQPGGLEGSIPSLPADPSEEAEPPPVEYSEALLLERDASEIAKLPLEAFGREYDHLDVQGIVNWMLDNPADLPAGVRQFVRHRPSFLASATSFVMDGQRFDLFLMCKESLYELHVVLVAGGNSTYLVDRSFQRLSSYISEGRVRREQRGGIAAIRSEQTSASTETIRDFYSVFLSWWERENAILD